MKGIVVTSTIGITGKGKAKTRLTVIYFNKGKREENRAGLEETDGTWRIQCTDTEF